MILSLLADATSAATDTLIPGVSGWVGAGLLGLVLSWLLFVHLPNKDKQLKEFVDAKDALVRDLTVKFKEALDIVISHCDEEIKACYESRDRILNKFLGNKGE